ncbi:hypothetical protein EDD18DRAFT_1111541 [Armillaria luteobubalina]|uniref:Uncharacterized protein n=1 Tax=Armillaria luteobubalina TaxID=153913 RepID=A0AA39PJE8_9AGAR|nr:hypothetical protein EDD18DRAFT_1111541 [Armillaria luteobubalina]
MAFTKASCCCTAFPIGVCMKAIVVFILLVSLVVVLFQTFKRVGSLVKETVIPHVLAIHVVMADNSVMEVVEEEVADMPVDVALADEPAEYMVRIDNFVTEAVDEEVIEILVDVAVAIASTTAVLRIPIKTGKTAMLVQRS